MVMQLLMLAQIDLAPGESIKPLPIPAILKPRPLWTGKQVITHLLAHLHPDACTLTCEHGTKTAASAWTGMYGGKADPDDGKVIVRHGELLCNRSPWPGRIRESSSALTSHGFWSWTTTRLVHGVALSSLMTTPRWGSRWCSRASRRTGGSSTCQDQARLHRHPRHRCPGSRQTPVITASKPPPWPRC